MRAATSCTPWPWRTRPQSTTYGGDEYKVPPDYATYVYGLFAQLGARGTSVLLASGVGEGTARPRRLRRLPCPVRPHLSRNLNERVAFLSLLASSTQTLAHIAHHTGHTFPRSLGH